MAERIRVAIVGSAGHARVVADILRRDDSVQLIGLFDPVKPRGSVQFGLPILGTTDRLGDLLANDELDSVIIGVGDNHVRCTLARKLRTRYPRLRFPVAAHDHSMISEDAIVGAGSVIGAGAVVGPGAEVGEGCIVNTNASLDHDCRMGAYASLGPNVATGGNVRIGDGTAVGIGAAISHGVEIGRDTVIGAGSTVIANIGDGLVAYGVPARVVSKRAAGDKYL